MGHVEPPVKKVMEQLLGFIRERGQMYGKS